MDIQQICPECGSGHTVTKTSRYRELSNRWIECGECGSKWLTEFKVASFIKYPPQPEGITPCR